jgi:hypothetical protein
MLAGRSDRRRRRHAPALPLPGVALSGGYPRTTAFGVELENPEPRFMVTLGKWRFAGISTPQLLENNGRLADDAVHLEHLRVLLVDVDPVRARDVPHVLGVRVATVLLRRVVL